MIRSAIFTPPIIATIPAASFGLAEINSDPDSVVSIATAAVSELTKIVLDRYQGLDPIDTPLQRIDSKSSSLKVAFFAVVSIAGHVTGCLRVSKHYYCQTSGYAER